MKTSQLIAVAVLAVATVTALTGCSNDATPAATAVSSQRTPAAVGSSTETITPSATAESTPPAMTFEVGGKWYPEKFYNCALAIWNSRVAEGNKLVGKRDAAGANDVVVNGVHYPEAADYSKAKGWPATFEATVTDPRTIKVCGRP
jgi:hypothetical protein